MLPVDVLDVAADVLTLTLIHAYVGYMIIHFMHQRYVFPKYTSLTCAVLQNFFHELAHFYEEGKCYYFVPVLK